MLIQAIKKITPQFLRRILKNELKKSRSLQKVGGNSGNSFKSIHLQSAKLLADRIQLLNALPKKGIVAEVGVAEGDFSQQILDITDPKKLHLIDAWQNKRYSRSMYEEVKIKFKKEIESDRIKIHKALSTSTGAYFPDHYFDWIYLDTDHSYETTKEELEIFRKKVKRNGIISGHDFTKGNFDDWIRYGVLEAVIEFCNKYDWELIYMTMELTEYPSFAIRSIKI